MSDTSSVPALPSATVILLRDTDKSIETLLLRRNSKLAFHGGAWVFPGGQIDPEDHVAPEGQVTEAHDTMRVAARRAAVREAYEEAGLVVAPKDLVLFAHWTTPLGRPQRFSTWFFVAAAREGAVRVDGGEIHAHRWMQPEQALAAQRAGEIELPPPTFVSLHKLSVHRTVSAALSSLAGRPPEIFCPRIHRIPDGACALYQEDAGYDNGNVDQPGPRHRLWMVKSGWCYERSE